MADDLTNTNAYLAAQMSATIQEYLNYANTDIAVYTTPPNGGPFGNGYVVFTTVTNGTIIQPSYPTVIASISNAGADAAVNAANNAMNAANAAAISANSALAANTAVYEAISNISGVFAANASAWTAAELANAAAAEAILANSWAWAAVANSNGGGGGGGVGSISLTGDITGSGLGTINTTLKNVGIAGTYTQVTTDSKGRVIAGAQANGGSALTYIPARQDQTTSFGGDVSGSGAANSTVTLTLNSIVTPGVFTKVSVDSKGRVTNGATVTGTDIITSLGYTPAHPDQTVTLIGDTAGSGAANAAITTTLANVGSPGTYTRVTTDSKGRVISGGTTSSTDVSNALGYIPAHQDQILFHSGGDVIGNGAANAAIAIFLTTAGTPGTYTKVTTDSKGRVIAGSNIGSADVLPAIGYIPARQDQTLTHIGDVTGTGAANSSITMTLANSGVAGTYLKVITDTKGRVVSNDVMNAVDVTTALGYTPAHQDQTIAHGGDVTGSGAANSTIAITLVNTAVAAGTYSLPHAITVDSKGRLTNAVVMGVTGDLANITSAGGVLTYNLNAVGTAGTYTKVITDSKGRVVGNSALTNSDISTALNYTPAHQDQTVTLIGDATGSGAANSSITTTLASAGTPGTYTKVTTDSKGRVITGSNIASLDVTTALGFTPARQDQNESFTGDVSGSGAANSTISITLVNSGVVPGTYTRFVTDSKGRITAGSAVGSSDITASLGYSPAHKDQTLSFSGDVTGSGAANTSVSLTLVNTNVDADLYNPSGAMLTQFTVNSKGLLTGADDYTVAYVGDVTSPNWTLTTNVAVSYLVVGGGGGGGGGFDWNGGGGGGGVANGSTFITNTGAWVVTIGSGGTGGDVNSMNYIGNNGGNSSVFGTVGFGGFGGGTNVTAFPITGGFSGGNQNNPGGVYDAVHGNTGGGGGAGGAGGNATTTGGGAGGIGLAYSITGSVVHYGPGGGGGGGVIPTGSNATATHYPGGPGGIDGGGDGGTSSTDGSTSGIGHTGTGYGAGGGGGGDPNGLPSPGIRAGGAGNNGVVHIAYPQRYLTATGGSISNVGGVTIHTFTSSGIFAVSKIHGTINYNMVASNTSVAPGTYFAPKLTVDAKGRVTTANSASFSNTSTGSTTFTANSPTASNMTVKRWMAITDDLGQTLYMPLFGP